MVLNRALLCICVLSACVLASVFFLKPLYGQQQGGPVEPAPGQPVLKPPGVVTSEPGANPPGGSMQGKGAAGPPPMAASGQTLPTGPTGPLFFGAGAVSPDGKNLFVVFDTYLLQYSLPELKQVRKVQLEFQPVPVTPSISLSPDGKYIYIIQNGTIFQIESATLKIKMSEKLKP